jgi:hypothetical protein
VARVISTKIQKTAAMPSFGMPAYGQTSIEAGALAGITGVQVSTCAHVRHTGDMGLATAKDVFPGTRAWRPPTC